MNLNSLKIGFIGFGNMGQAMARGWIKSGQINASQLYASAKNLEKLQTITTELDMHAIPTNEDLVERVDLIILAVKPHLISTVIQPLKDKLKNKLVVSVAVNMLNADFNVLLGTDIEHLSTLPNTPVSIGEGIIIFEEDHTLVPENHLLVTQLFELISHVENISTEQMGIAGLISGSAPAFVDLFIEALGDAAVKHGLNRQTAYRLVSKMVSGTGELQLATGKHPGELKDEITSPNGTTIKGVASLEKNHFRGTLIEAVDAILDN